MTRTFAALFVALFPAAVSAQELPLEAKTHTDAAGKALPYRLLRPETIEAGKTYPLVIFLHGAGERGTDNKKQMIHGVPEFAKAANRKAYPCFLIAPQCPSQARWVEVDWSAKSHVTPEKPSEPMRLLFELVDALMKELPIDAQRVYITGLSMGGYGTWDAACRRPDLFAAAAPVCGGGDDLQAAKIAKLAVWAFHGDKDTVVLPLRSRNMIEAVKKAGGEPKYTEYKGVGHNAWGPAYKDPELLKWMFDCRKP